VASSSTTGTVRVVVVDDTPDLRLLLRLTLERDGDITVVGEAADGRQGIEVVARLQPELVMLDLAMPVMDGIEALPQIKEACPEARVVVLSGFEAGAMEERSRKAGADAYLQKGTSPREILTVVRGLLGRVPDAATLPAARPPADDRSPAVASQDERRPIARRAAEEAPVGLLMVAGARAGGDRLAYLNPAAAAMLDLPSDAAGGHLDELVPPLAALLARSLGRDLAGEGVEDRLIAGGRTLDVSLRAAGGDVVISLAPARTDGEVDRLRQAIRTTAHEIRNPVTLLSGVASVVADAGTSLTEQQHTHLLAAVGRQAAVLERVTDDLLTAAQAGRGVLRLDVRAVDLSPLLENVVSDVAGQQPVSVTVPPGLRALADRTRVSQMVANLLTNAFKYADAPYVVEAGAVAASRPWVRIAVLDSGPGVDPDFRPRLFDEFARAEASREQGTGLGLYVVRSLAEAHGGRADYAPRPDGGSEFTIHLPAVG
jgi:signal transduction histidine kinase